ncbi:response regulator transcription factor [Streptomyces sp. NPDC053048]|uniref:response regulator transcription factor n=1 Tax=Streptomyces sp. NPDC053048 TaxID=3365694 RepID=UPI0037D1BF5C
MNETAVITTPASNEPHWMPALQRVDRLTPREREVFVLLAEGLSNDQMARRLWVSERTVRAHLSAVLEKLELGSRLCGCLASYAFRTSGTHHRSRSASRDRPAG